MGLPSALCFLVLSLGQCRVNAKVCKEDNRASEAHANDSSLQIARTTIDLVDLEEALGVAHTALRCTVCSIGAYSKGTYKVNRIWHKLRRRPWDGHCTRCEGKAHLHREAAKLVQLQQHNVFLGIRHLESRKMHSEEPKQDLSRSCQVAVQCLQW